MQTFTNCNSCAPRVRKFSRRVLQRRSAGHRRSAGLTTARGCTNGCASTTKGYAAPPQQQILAERGRLHSRRMDRARDGPAGAASSNASRAAALRGSPRRASQHVRQQSHGLQSCTKYFGLCSPYKFPRKWLQRHPVPCKIQIKAGSSIMCPHNTQATRYSRCDICSHT